MSIKVVPFSAEWEKKWDAFVDASRNGTLFHLRKFFQYHPNDRFEDASVLFLDGEEIVGVFPAAHKEKKLVSHPGASYGGIVLLKEGSVPMTGEILDVLEAHTKSKKYSAIEMLRLPPSSLHRWFSEDPQYWMFQKGYTLSKVEMDGAVDLSGLSKDDVLSSLTGKCRNMVRQAERAGISVSLSEDFASYWKLLEDVLKQRHEAKPTHTLAEIQKLKSLLPGRVRLLAAFQQKKIVGGIVLITVNDAALYTLYMAQDYAAQEDHPMHLLLTEAMKLAIKEKCRALHLGVSTEDGGKKINEGLFFFKESFGCKPVRRETWSKAL